MEKEVDVVALGELLIDFTEVGRSKSGKKLFEQNPGGAPANLLTVVSHMGYRTEFVGKIGSDMQGRFLRDTVQQEGIGTKYLIEDKDCFTTLAFVEIGQSGEREFSFARKPGADTQLKKEELCPELFEDCKIFHFGSLSLTDEPARSATIQAVEMAKAAGALISYDPNYRAPLWQSREEAVERIKSVMHYVDVMKVSDEEVVLLTGMRDYGQAVDKLLQMGPKVLAVTLGNEGVLMAAKGQKEKISGFKVNAIDTTGAGDSFWGGFLSEYLRLKKSIAELNWDEIVNCALCGNATAALCVQRRGGIPAIPSKEEVMRLINTSGLLR